MSTSEEHNIHPLALAYARHELVYEKGVPVDYKVLEANDSFFEITGKQAQEIIGLPAKSVFLDLEQEWLDRYIKLAIEGGELHFRKFAQGLNKHFEVYAFSTEKDFFIVLFIDLSEIENQKKQLCEENDYFLTTLQSIGDGVIVTDIKGCITLMNTVAEESTGFLTQEAKGMPIESIFNIINSESREKVENPIQRVLEEGKIVGLANHTSLISRSGREYNIADSAAPIIGSDGKWKGVVLVFRDITEEYKNREKLRLSENRFRNLFQNIPEAIILIEHDRIVDCNRFFLDLFECQRDDMLGRHPSDISPEFQHDGSHSRAKAAEKIALALGGEVQRFYWTHQRFDGSTLFCDISLTRVEVEGSKILFSVVRDITDKVTLQEKINQNERFLSNLISNLPGFAYQCANNSNWDMLFISEGCYDITGYSNTDFYEHNVNFGDLILPQYKDEIWQKWQKILSEKEYFEHEYPIRHKSGKIKWLWERGNGIFSKQGELLCLEGFISDISDKYQLQNNLRESEAKYRSLVENAFDGIFLSDELTLLYANEKFAEILGFPLEYFLDNPDAMYDRLTPESRRFVLQRHHDRVEGKFVDPIFKLEWRKPDETICIIEVSTSQIELDGEVRFIGLVRDVSDAVKLNNALREAKTHAEEISKLKSVILANMSHELRTPLSGILGFSEILLEKLNDPELVEMAQYIKASGHRLLNTLDSIITYGKLESGFISINIAPLNIIEIVKECIQEYSGDASSKNIEILFKPDESVSWMHSDFRFIKIALKGVIHNAIKFTPKGGRVVISYSKALDNKGIVIGVQDNGIGIPEDHFELIFEDFRQVSEGNTRVFEGTGLGLSLVRKTVEILNGSIQVESKAGEGALFSIFIPDEKPT